MPFVLLVVLLAAQLFAGCESPPELHIKIVANDPTALVLGHKAVEAWGILGFVNDEQGTEIKIKRVIDLRADDQYMGQLYGHADRKNNIVLIDAGLKGDAAQHVVTHELAHIILRCDHLIAPKQGIMLDGRYRVGWALVPTGDDLDLACESVGLCVDHD